MIAKHPITRSEWRDKGYVFLCTAIADLPMVAWSTHKCEQPMSDREYIRRFQKSHDKQIDSFIKLELESQAKDGLIIDESLVKKYLPNGV